MANTSEKMSADVKEDDQVTTMTDNVEDNAEYGNCEGPDSMYIKLISSDKHEFIIKKEHALMSNTINAMLSGPGQFLKGETNIIHLKETPSHIVHQVCLYLAYKARYLNSTTHVPEFIVPPEMAVELLLASNFLHC